MNLHPLICYRNTSRLKKNYDNKVIANDTDHDSYIMPELDETDDISLFLQFPSFDNDQILDLQECLSGTVSKISTEFAKQLLQRVVNSFQDGDPKKNSIVLLNIVHILRNVEYFISAFSDIYLSIADSYLNQNVTKECLLQALYLTEIIVQKTSLRVPPEKFCFLMTLLSNDSFEPENKLIVIRILLNQIYVDIPFDVIDNLITILTKLLNVDLSLQVQSLKLITEIMNKISFPLSNDQIEFYFQFANSAHIETALSALKLFDSYSRSPPAAPQLFEFNIIEKLLHVHLFIYPSIAYHVLRIYSILLENNDIFGQQILTLIYLGDYFTSQYPTQVIILNIIYSLSMKEMIQSLREISPNAFEFILNFLESDNEQILFWTLSIIYRFQNEMAQIMEKQHIEAIEQCKIHENEKISQLATLFHF